MGIFDFLKGKKNNSNDSVLRVNWDDTEDVGIITHYKGNPVTGICYNLHDNGNLMEEVELVNGLKHGINNSFFKNGQVQKIGSYKNDKEDGIYKSYSDDGTLTTEGNMKNGKLNGIWKHYRQGKVIYEGTYNNNKPIKESGDMLIGYVIKMKGMNEEELKDYFPFEMTENQESEIEEKNLKSNEEKSEKDNVTNSELRVNIEEIDIENGQLIGDYRDNILHKSYWSRELIITRPGEVSLTIPLEIQKTEFSNFFLDNKPFNGVVYSIYNQENFLKLPPKEEQIIRQVSEIENGILHGSNKTFYVDGNLEKEKTMYEGRVNGIEKGYYEDDGSLDYIKEWKDDELEKLMIFRVNKKIHEVNFKLGEVISKKCWDEDGNEIECEDE